VIVDMAGRLAAALEAPCSIPETAADGPSERISEVGERWRGVPVFNMEVLVLNSPTPDAVVTVPLLSTKTFPTCTTSSEFEVDLAMTFFSR
jgi:hypothetical protein